MSLATLYSTDVPALDDTATLRDALAQMLRHRVTDLPVLDAQGRFLGMFKLGRMFEGLLPRAALIGYGMPDLGFVSTGIDDLRHHMRDIEHRLVREFLMPPEHTVAPDTSPLEVVLLLYRGANNVPVVTRESGKLVGMISARDLLSALHREP